MRTNKRKGGLGLGGGGVGGQQSQTAVHLLNKSNLAWHYKHCNSYTQVLSNFASDREFPRRVTHGVCLF